MMLFVLFVSFVVRYPLFLPRKTRRATRVILERQAAGVPSFLVYNEKGTIYTAKVLMRRFSSSCQRLCAPEPMILAIGDGLVDGYGPPVSESI
jgi:hypothetical protein